ncbi:FN3 associated domain-containing protein [Paenibacillus hodogayensis]|uniref:FN3 associated domain-containing protein n=1 Tax=Paenibacillus hodogayensis TaxID=279208 RepID=A0ABV5VTA1_9BACL
MVLKRKAVYAALFAVLLLTVSAWTGLRLFRAEAVSGTWLEHADTDWYISTYASFVIDTPEKLAGIAKLVNEGKRADGTPVQVNGFSGKLLQVDRNLDLSAYAWVPIGTASSPFRGSLIAQGGQVFTVSGMSITGGAIYAGLVGFMDNGTVGGFVFAGNGTISVTENVYGGSVSNDVYGGLYAGAAVGRMINNSAVYNVTNQIALNVNALSTSVYAGGIVGSGEGSVSNSFNQAPVTVSGANAHAGGIVGRADNGGLKVKKATNNGAVGVSGSGALHAGGIAGSALGSIVMAEDNTPLVNTAAVKIAGGQTGYAGGIVGKAGGEASFSNNTTNSGAVEIEAASASGTYAGGLAGAITAQQIDPVFSLAFANTAPVVNHGGANVHTGGLAGLIASSFTWEQSYVNTVGITATGSGPMYTGGLIGHITGDLRFGGFAKNTAPIAVSGGALAAKPDEAYTAGLVGYAGGRVLFDHPAAQAYGNSGAITVHGGTGLYTGGVVGNRAYARTSGEPSSNVYSTAKITVIGQTKLYTGGFIGLVPNEGADKAISGASFTNEIEVTGAASDASHTISTGGIVGYYVNGSGSGTVNQSSFQGKLTSTGGSYAYTGGIAGYMDGGKITGVQVGNTAADYAAIRADGVIGGVAGYSKGTIDTAAVVFTKLTVRTKDGSAGGIAGKAQGVIQAATVGDAAYADGYSVRVEADVRNAPDGIDRLTAGGIVGQNEAALTIAASAVENVGLLNESGRSQYTLGGVAGSLTGEASVGAAGTPVRVKQLKFEIKSDDSRIGGAFGASRAPIAYVKTEQLDFRITAANARAGGIAGVYDVAPGTIPAEAVHGTGEHPLVASGIAFDSQGTAARVGGLFGENSGFTQRGLAERIAIGSSGASNRVGGIAGSNSGTLENSESRHAVISVQGMAAEAGGVAGHSEAPAGGAAAAVVSGALVTAGEEPLVTTTVPNSFVGGIVGWAKTTDITNPRVTAVAPDYAILSVQAAQVAVGGIAGRIEQGKIAGDATLTNAENVLISTSAASVSSSVGGIAGYSEKTKIERLSTQKVNLVVNGGETVVGGIAGYNRGSNTGIIANNYMADLSIKVNAGAVSPTVGGFVGLNDAREGDAGLNPATAVSTIQNSRIVGSVQVAAPSSVTGGMVGENRTLVANNSIADKIPVAVKGDGSTIGGLVGLNTEAGTLYYTYSNANLTIEGRDTLGGGLVGHNKGRVLSSYVDIDIVGRATGTDSQSVFLGGLVGRNSGGGTIDKSYNGSKVTAEGIYSVVGGLVGEHAGGAITNSYAAREVTASADYSYAGGFIGRIVNGTVTTSYSAGQVYAAGGAYAGGFAGRYDNPSKELLYKNYYVKDEDEKINHDLPDFAEGNHRWLQVHVRLSTILASTLKERDIFPALSTWDFSDTWKYGSLKSDYKYPELYRSANTGGDGGSGSDVNANINWYMRDKDAIYYDIRTEAELAGLAAVVNGSFPGVERFSFEDRIVRIANPIHIQSKQWVPIGSSEANPFQGKLEGNAHLIDGLSLIPDQTYSGLFGVIGPKGQVDNVVMEPLSVAGQQFTGVLAGVNQGKVSRISIKLLNGSTVSGGTVGGVLGRNTGTFEAISLSLEGGSRIEATGTGSIAGGLVGDNVMALHPGLYQFTITEGSIGSLAGNATVGGLIGQQSGDVSGISRPINAAYRIYAAGAGNTLGGLIGRQISGTADGLAVTFTDGVLEAKGAGSVAGGLIGRSEAGGLIRNATVTATGEGRTISANGTVGGIVGSKEGSGTNKFDMENVKVDKIVLVTLEPSAEALAGGIAGELTNAAVHQAVFDATLRASGVNVTAGGIVGKAVHSILYKSDVVSDIAVIGSGTSAVGGIAGVIASHDVHASLDFGGMIPLYRGIYEANVHSKTIEAKGSGSSADLFVGGIVGQNRTASIYSAKSTSDLLADGARTIAAGGIAGASDGVIVGSWAQNGITAGAGTVYEVGGIVGRATGGAIHYTRITAPNGQKIAIGAAVRNPGAVPATRVGGFVGRGDAVAVTDSFADIPVEVLCDNPDNTIHAGGFAGLLGDAGIGDARMERVYATGAVAVKGITGSYVGGFAGSVDRYVIVDAYATGNAANTGFDTASGGFAGVVERRAVIRHAYSSQRSIATTGINHATRSYTGGFVGYNDGTLEDVFAREPDIAVNVSGANVYKGSLVGYQFRDGKVIRSAYLGGMNPIGYNQGGSADVSRQDVFGNYAFGDWSFDLDAAFLIDAKGAELTLYNAQQLGGAVALYNDPTALGLYRLFKRDATEKPEIARIVLAADIDLSGRLWKPFADFRGFLDGKGHTITGFRLTKPAADLQGFIAENRGRVANIRFMQAEVQAGSKAGIVAGINHPGASIDDVSVIAGTVNGTDFIGGLIGFNGGAITGSSFLGIVTATGGPSGGIAGYNEGRLERVYTGGAAIDNAVGPALSAVTVSVGGLVGENAPVGYIGNGFSYMDVSAGGDHAIAGGIVGTNRGEVVQVYASGKVGANGLAEAKAGGIAGYAERGSIAGAVYVGEATASVEGKIKRGKAQFGGIAGRKDAAATISNAYFNKQMLKDATAYYDQSGARADGAVGEAIGLSARQLTGSSLPAGLDAAAWRSAQGFYPQLASFAGQDVSKLAAAAVVLNDSDLVHRIGSPFELTRDNKVVWSAEDAAALSIVDAAGTIKGTLKTKDAAKLRVTVQDYSRPIVLNAPAPLYEETAKAPVFGTSSRTFTGSLSVTLSADEPSARIYYTLNGGQPGTNSTLYNGPIQLSDSGTIRAVTMVAGKEPSEVLTGTFSRQAVGGGGGFYVPPAPDITMQIGSNTVKSDGKTPVTIALNSKLTLTAPKGSIIYYTTDGSVPTKKSAVYKDGIIITGNTVIKAITDKDDRVMTFSYEVEKAKFDMKGEAGRIPYMTGYENGLFKPDAALTRYELVEALEPLLDREDVTVAGLLEDVKESAEPLVAFFASAGLIEGYPDGTFRGNNGLTRAEFVAMMSRVLKLDIADAGETLLADVSGHWAEKYVNAFTKAGYVDGFPDGTFMPDGEITRAQAVVVINRIIGMKNERLPARFSDLTADHWAYDYIMPALK